MPRSLERSKLHVEGQDDQYSIINILIRHGIDYDAKPWPAVYPELEKIGGVQELLEGMELAIRLSGGRVIGFVLDADTPLRDRWQAVCARLIKVGVQNIPPNPPPDGFIGESTDYHSRVGVWLMPDNQQDGTLESFLQALIGAGDPLINHAEASTDAALQLGARFSATDHIKAIIHAWLAWQKVPGLPYGSAIRAQYFRHDSLAALKFVTWFKQLYQINFS